MIYLELFFGFLKVGCFSFGGAYGAIPLIRDAVLQHGWLDEATLAYMIAISESTPGPIMVNMATYVGLSQAGIVGAALATLAVVLPSFVIILLFVYALKKVWDNAYIQALLDGVRPCVTGIVLAVGVYMIFSNCFPAGGGQNPDMRTCFTTLLLGSIWFVRKYKYKKKSSPIHLILFSAVVGMIVWGI